MKMHTKKLKYVLTLILFTLSFFVLMSFLLVKYQSLTNTYKQTPVDQRIDWIKDSFSYGNPHNITTDLCAFNSYEQPFDPYWEFATVEAYYYQGLTLKRALAEGEMNEETYYNECLSYIKQYVTKTSDENLKKMAKAFLDDLND